MSLDQLQGHFGFSRLPFGRGIAAARLHRSRAHREACARIAFLIAQGQIGLLTGEVGAGKTTALRAATEPLDRSRHTIVYLPNPAVGERGLYQAVIAALGGRRRFHKAELINQAYELLLRESEERRKQVTLCIDEAHLLSAQQLEELRMLTTAEMDSRQSMGLILLCQPQLRRYLRMGYFAALDQRIALRYELPGMEPGETASYVRHHLELAGRKDGLFSDDALEVIHHAARGLPRHVNNLAIQALIAALIEGKAIVDQRCAQQAVCEVTAE
jgi:type II secretory pathway predicted ATPase ExeA